jgi:hypothetical protein
MGLAPRVALHTRAIHRAGYGLVCRSLKCEQLGTPRGCAREADVVTCIGGTGNETVDWDSQPDCPSDILVMPDMFKANKNCRRQMGFIPSDEGRMFEKDRQV